MAMSPEDSVFVFEQYCLAPTNKDWDTILTLLRAVLSFYRHHRFSGLAESEGDMLLFQYGVYDWGSGPCFELDLTRQFVEQERDDDDDVFSQFHLTCFYAADERLTALGKDSRWCPDLSELDQFAAWVVGHPVLAAVATLPRLSTEVIWERV